MNDRADRREIRFWVPGIRLQENWILNRRTHELRGCALRQRGCDRRENIPTVEGCADIRQKIGAVCNMPDLRSGMQA